MIEVLRHLSGDIYSSWRTGQLYDLSGLPKQDQMNMTVISQEILEGREHFPGQVVDTIPSITASDNLVGRTLSISIDTLTGTPNPSVELTTLTLDEVDVLVEAIGSNPWSYEIPSSGDAQVLAWVITATNSEGSDTASGSETVAGDLSPPLVSTSDSLAGRTLTISIDSLTGVPAPSTALTTLTRNGVNVLGDATGSGPWQYQVPSSASPQTVSWGVTATNSEGSDTATGSETVAADQTVPSVTASDSLAGRTLTITLDSLSGVPAPTAALTTLTLNGANVLVDAAGTGPWTYEVPSSTSAQTVAWTVTATSAAGSAVSGGSESVPADQVATEVDFGALTLVGQGGVDVSGAGVADGPYGQFTVTGGVLAPNTTPLTPGVVSVGSVTVTVVADVRSVATTAQFRQAMQDEAGINGKVIEYRGDVDYGEVNQYNSLDQSQLPNRVVIRPDRENPVPITWFSVDGAGGGTYGNVDFRNVRFARNQTLTAHNFVEPQSSSYAGERGQLVNLGPQARSCTFDGCEFFSDHTDSKSGGLLVNEIRGIVAGGDDHHITNCSFHKLTIGAEISANVFTFEGNHVYDIYSDFLRVRNAANGTIRNNDMGGIIGFGNLLHQDGIQLTGDCEGTVMEGNVIYPGAFITRCLTQSRPLLSGDQAQEFVNVASSTTLTEAAHNGRIARATADGLTFTLPASPGLGDSYWFLVNDSGHSLTVAANSGQTHGGGLLPRTVDNNSNLRSFMVYWDGSEWQTQYGIRSGMHYITAGTVTLSDRFDGRTLLFDASAGNIDVTLPAVFAGAQGIGLIRRDSTGNTVTVRLASGDTFQDEYGGTPATLTITQDQGYSVRELGGSNVWSVLNGTKGELQGIFGNGGSYVFSNIRSRGNVIWSNASHGYRLEDDFPNEVCEHNTFLRTFPVDLNADGQIDGIDGFFDIQGGRSPGVRFKGDAAQTTGRRAMRNITTGDLVLGEGNDTTTEIYSFENIALGITSATAFPSTYFNGTTPADYYPTTRAEAISMARAKVGGPLDGTWIGAVGTTDANGWWDFTTGQRNPAAPDSTASAVPYTFEAAWVSAATGGDGGEIDVTLALEAYSNPAMTDVEVEFDNSGVWDSLGATARGTHTITKSPGTAYTITGIRAVNSQGTGPATTLSVAVTSGTSSLSFANSLVIADYANAAWNDFGVGKNIVGNWLIKPGGRVRADTLTGAWTNPGGDITIVVDVRVSAGSGASTVTCRLNEVGGSGTSDGTIAPLTGVTGGNGGFTTVGSIDMGGGVWRFYMQRTVSAGTRILVELPQGNTPAADMTNPAIFAGTLTVPEITALA